MAGVTVVVDDGALRAALERLRRAGADLSLPLRDIGEYLLLAHRERWDRQVSPDGSAWAPLAAATLRRKQARLTSRRRGRAGASPQILVESGDLRDLLRYQVEAGGTQLRLGTDRKYGATHQLGDSARNIPARPFLGLSEADRAHVLTLLAGHIERAIAGR